MYNRLVEDKKMRRTSLQVLLPHMPSSDSLISSSSPGPASPPGELTYLSYLRHKYHIETHF